MDLHQLLMGRGREEKGNEKGKEAEEKRGEKGGEKRWRPFSKLSTQEVRLLFFLFLPG